MYEVRHVNVSSQVKIFSLILAVLYFIIGFVVTLANVFVNPGVDKIAQFTSGIFSVVLGSVVAFLVGAVLSWIFGFLYNALASRSGGLKVTFRLTMDQPHEKK